MVLLRLAPLVRNTESKLTIVPEYPIAKTKMEEGQSLGDIVDYLLARHPAEHSGYCLSSLHMNRADGFLCLDHVLEHPVLTFGRHTTGEFGTFVIFEAKTQSLLISGIPQGVMAVAAWCKRYECDFNPADKT